jgi:hypothetical protein
MTNRPRQTWHVVSCRLSRSLIPIQPSVLNFAVYRPSSFYSKIINHLPRLEGRPEYRKYLVNPSRSSLVSFNHLWSPHLWKRLLTCSPSSCASWGQVLPCCPLLPMQLLLPLQRLLKLESSSGRPRLPPVPPSPSISFSVSPSQPNPSVLACLSLPLGMYLV